ncbi:NPY1_2 [Sanghuangporus sanghuang]
MTETHVNFLAGSPLNRLSWLRTSTPFLTAVLASQRSLWVLFRGGEPLVRIDATKKSHGLARLSMSIISP